MSGLLVTTPSAQHDESSMVGSNILFSADLM